jgi:hypothetical protein
MKGKGFEPFSWPEGDAFDPPSVCVIGGEVDPLGGRIHMRIGTASE